MVKIKNQTKEKRVTQTKGTHNGERALLWGINTDRTPLFSYPTHPLSPLKRRRGWNPGRLGPHGFREFWQHLKFIPFRIPGQVAHNQRFKGETAEAFCYTLCFHVNPRHPFFLIFRIKSTVFCVHGKIYRVRTQSFWAFFLFFPEFTFFLGEVRKPTTHLRGSQLQKKVKGKKWCFFSIFSFSVFPAKCFFPSENLIISHNHFQRSEKNSARKKQNFYSLTRIFQKVAELKLFRGKNKYGTFVSVAHILVIVM